MKSIVLAVLAAATLPVFAQATPELAVQRYEQALNAGDAQAAAALFTADGVMLAPDKPGAVGAQAVGDALAGTFKAIGLALRFQVAEVKPLGADWALLRSTSQGTVTIRANGAEVPAAFQELFALQRVAGDWKIARYAFSSTLAPAAK